MVRTAGVEPTTFGFGDRRSIQLSYARSAANLANPVSPRKFLLNNSCVGGRMRWPQHRFLTDPNGGKPRMDANGHECLANQRFELEGAEKTERNTKAGHQLVRRRPDSLYGDLE